VVPARLSWRAGRAALWAVGLLLVTLACLVHAGWDRSLIDAKAYWEAAARLRAGAPLYGLAPSSEMERAYLYPPAFAALFAPLTLLPPAWGYALWMGLHLPLLLAAIGTLESLCGLRSPRRRMRHRLLLAGALLLPLVGEIEEGQANLLMLASLALGLRALERGRLVAGGLLVALPAHVKLVPVVVLLALLAQRRWRAARATAFGLLGLTLLPLAWTVPALGPLAGAERCLDMHLEFVRRVIAPAGEGAVRGFEQFYASNHSIAAWLHRLFAEGVRFSPFPGLADWRGPLLFTLPRAALRATALVAALLLLAAALHRARGLAGERRGGVLGIGLVLTAAQLGSVTFWEHHMVFLALLLTPLAAVRDPPRLARAGLWLLAAGMTLPFLLHVALLLSGGAEGSPWMRLLQLGRSWGFVTLAVLVLWLGALRSVAPGTEAPASGSDERGTPQALDPVPSGQ
jgi:hypothetical protein